MYAVIFNRKVVYSGTDLLEALQAFGQKSDSTLHNVENLDDIREYIGPQPDPLDELMHSVFSSICKAPVQKRTEPEPSSATLSQAAQTLLDKLEEFGMNQSLSEKIAENSEKLVAEVRHIGTRGMKTVGDGFIALGDVLRKAYNRQ